MLSAGGSTPRVPAEGLDAGSGGGPPTLGQSGTWPPIGSAIGTVKLSASTSRRGPSTKAEIFISGTQLEGRYVLRLAVGNAWTTEEDVRRAWDLIRREAAQL